MYIMNNKSARDRFELKGFGAFGIIWVAIGSILGGAALGYLVDHLFGTFPVFLIVLMLCGVFGGFFMAYKAIMKDFEKK